MNKTHDAVYELFQKWVPKLRLNAWTIKIDISDDIPDDDPAVLGYTQFNPECLTASVWIKDPNHCEHQYGLEHTVVHELLHLVLSDFVIESHIHLVALERAINIIASSLTQSQMEPAGVYRSKSPYVKKGEHDPS